MSRISSWFLKELEIIDSSYFIVFNELYRYFEIKRRMTLDTKIQTEGSVTSDGQGMRVRTPSQIIRLSIKNPTVAVFRVLNDNALLELRKRKYLGLKFERIHNPDAYLDWIVKRNQEAKQKKREFAAEMAAEGFMKIHKLQHSKMFDMGGRP